MQDPQAIISEIEHSEAADPSFNLSADEMAQLFSVNRNVLVDNLDAARTDLKSLLEHYKTFVNKSNPAIDFSKYDRKTLATIAKNLVTKFQELLSLANAEGLEIIKVIDLTKNWINTFELLCYFDPEIGRLLIDDSTEWVKNRLIPELVLCRQQCEQQQVSSYSKKITKLLLIIDYKFTGSLNVAKNCHKLFLYYFNQYKNNDNKDKHLSYMNQAFVYAKAANIFDKKYSFRKYLQHICKKMEDVYPEKAIEFYNLLSKTILEQKNNSSDIIYFYNLLASTYKKLWNISGDIQYLEKSLDNFKLAVEEKSRINKLEYPDPCLHMLVSLNITKSEYFQKQGDQESTLQSLQHALQYAITNKEARKISDSYKALGKYYQYRSDQAKNPTEQRENLKEAFYHFADAANNLLVHLYQHSIYTSEFLAIPNPKYEHIDDLDNEKIIFWTDRYETFINYYSNKDFETKHNFRARKPRAAILPFFSHSHNSNKDDSSKEIKLTLRRNKRTHEEIEDKSDSNEELHP